MLEEEVNEDKQEIRKKKEEGIQRMKTGKSSRLGGMALEKV